MALTPDESLLCEAIKSMLSHDAKLGLSLHTSEQAEQGTAERGYEYLHNQIDDMFASKAAEMLHAESVNRAFCKVHSYKYLDDPTFRVAMEKEMLAQAVPAEERSKALGFLPSIIEELKEEQTQWCEKDAGFNPKLDEIREASQPAQDLEFTIEDVEGWPMSSNVEWEAGDASPGHTP
jgi:hypothetical protein